MRFLLGSAEVFVALEKSAFSWALPEFPDTLDCLRRSAWPLYLLPAVSAGAKPSYMAGSTVEDVSAVAGVSAGPPKSASNFWAAADLLAAVSLGPPWLVLCGLAA